MQQVRDLRRAQRMTQEQLADELNVDVSNVQRWEYGETEPRERNKQRVADFFGVRVADIDWQPKWEKGERAKAWQQRTAENITT